MLFNTLNIGDKFKLNNYIYQKISKKESKIIKKNDKFISDGAITELFYYKNSNVIKEN
jgi:hypothetical protein